MKRILSIIILISIVTLNYCNKGHKNGSDGPTEYIKIDEHKVANVRFILKKRIEAVPIAYPRVAVSAYQDKLLIYGLSTMKSEESLLIARMYNKNLEFISEKSFRFGQGPEDASAFNMFSFTKDKILVSGNTNHRITTYNSDWSLNSIQKHRLSLDSFDICENGSFFLQGYFHWDDKWDYYSFRFGSIPSLNIKTFFTIGPFKLNNGKKSVIGGLTEYSWFYRNKEIYILDCGKYRIVKFDNKGKKLKDITVRVDELKTDHSLDETCFAEHGMRSLAKRFRFSDTVDPAATMIPLSKGFVVVRRHSYLVDCGGMTDGDYFSNQLVYLGKLKVPCIDALFWTHGGRRNEAFKYDNGFLYLILGQEETDWIEKWEVQE